ASSSPVGAVSAARRESSSSPRSGRSCCPGPTRSRQAVHGRRPPVTRESVAGGRSVSADATEKGGILLAESESVELPRDDLRHDIGKLLLEVFGGVDQMPPHGLVGIVRITGLDRLAYLF